MTAFSRFNLFMARITRMLESGLAQTREEAIIKLGGYASRGKGKGKVSKVYRHTTAFKVPHGGGAREVARRQRQLAAGTLCVS
jgi:hypothetical protein